MARVQIIGDYLGKKFNVSDTEMKDFDRVSDIYKFDLVTSMVGEFAELQGVMGMHYARLIGENENVSVAIKESYMPTSAEGDLPSTTVGSLLSIADKLDTIISFFGAGMIPSSSNDPYALRRNAYGIVRILLNEGWSLPIKDVLPELIQLLSGKTAAKLPKDAEAENEIADFIRDRVKQQLQVEKYDYDVIDAVLASSQQDPIQILAAAKTLQMHHDDADFKPVVESLTRITNILKKAKYRNANDIDESLFQDVSEEELYAGVNALEENTDLSIADLYKGFVELQPVINNYFESNMILDKDEKVKNNRLAQLLKVNNLADRMGDLSKLVNNS